MDSVLTAIIGIAPQLGGGGLLLGVLVLVLRREQQSAERFAAELTRVNQAHDAELAELRADITALRTQLDEVNAKLDDERARRRAAEDVASWQAQAGDEQQWRRQ